MYTNKGTKNNRIRWVCSNRAEYDWKGAITTSHQRPGWRDEVRARAAAAGCSRTGGPSELFRRTYVSGVLRPLRNTDLSRLLLQLTRTTPTFPALMWNQHRATVDGTERTNNACEGWNHSFASNIGHQHPSLWTLLGALQQDQAVVATQLLQNALGQPPAKRQKKSVASHQERLQNLWCRPRLLIDCPNIKLLKTWKNLWRQIIKVVNCYKFSLYAYIDVNIGPSLLCILLH